VVASGRSLRSYAGIAELMEHDLFERGVPKERILAARHRADNTRGRSTGDAGVSQANGEGNCSDLPAGRGTSIDMYFQERCRCA